VDKFAGERVDQNLRPFIISTTQPLLFIYLPATQCNQQLAATLSYAVMEENEGRKEGRKRLWRRKEKDISLGISLNFLHIDTVTVCCNSTRLLC